MDRAVTSETRSPIYCYPIVYTLITNLMH